MAGYSWSWRNPVSAFGGARAAQLGMKWEEAQIKKQGTLGAAAYGAESRVLGEQTRARATLGSQAMRGEQGMAQQTLRGKQGMERQRLIGEQAKYGVDVRAGTERDLATDARVAKETAYLRGGDTTPPPATVGKKNAYQNALKRLDDLKKEMGGYLTDPDTLKPLTPDQEDEFLKRIYKQEMGFFDNESTR